MFRSHSLIILVLAVMLSGCSGAVEPPEATGRVSVSVRDRNRTPIANATVMLAHGPDWIVPGRTPDTGVVEFEGLASGSYTVAVAVRGYDCGRATTVTLQRHVDLLVSCRPTPPENP